MTNFQSLMLRWRAASNSKGIVEIVGTVHFPDQANQQTIARVWRHGSNSKAESRVDFIVAACNAYADNQAALEANQQPAMNDDLADCFRHHITTTIGWTAFGARPSPEMQMYEDGFKAGYRRCQSDNELEFGEDTALEANQQEAVNLREILRRTENEALGYQQVVDTLRAAIEPFAKAATLIEARYGKDVPDEQFQFPELTMRDFREARAALPHTRSLKS